MEVCGNLVSEFINGCDELKKPSEEGADEKGGEKIPQEELDDARLAGMAFLPGDFGMEKVGEDGSKKIGNYTIEPKEFVTTSDDAGEESVNGEIK